MEDGSGASSASVCVDASTHVEDCTGSVVPFGDCGPEEAAAAEQLLGLSCDAVAAPPADTGKADFLESGNPLCALMLPARGIEEGGLCCFSHNCDGALVCRDYRCRPESTDGGPCERNGHCAAGLVCQTDALCGPASELGGPCEHGEQCDGALTCIGGSCAERSVDGGLCDTDESSDCDFGLFCDDGTCVPEVGEGGGCTTDEECDAFLACVAGECRQRGLEGDPCDAGDTRDCDLGLYCIGGSCAARPGLGEPCEREPSIMCGPDRTCWDGICEPDHGAGEPCEGIFDCEFGLFCEDGTCED